MQENKFSNHPFEYKKPTEPRITYLFSCHWLEGISSWKQGRNQPRQPMNVK